MLALLALPLIGLWILGYWVSEGVVAVIDLRKKRRELQRARTERELDRTQAQMRATILRLASELGADAHEARKALIRESLLASGRIPPE